MVQPPNIDDLDLLQSARDGDDRAFNEVLLKHRERLRRMVAVRMNQQLRGRLDASDIIQDAFVEAARVVDDYLKNPKLPVYLWLRQLAGQKLIQAHRHHLGAEKRNAEREQPIFGHAPAATSHCLALEFSGNMTSPSVVAMRQESKDELMSALESMDQLDREVLTLRHFEQLTSRESAAVLGLNHEMVKKRYVRALDKLQRLLPDS